MSKRVLICDDSMLMRKMIGETLAETGWEVAGEACDGKEAIEKYKLLKPDAVTMDIVMPGVDGLVGLAAIIESDPQAKVVMVSALNQTQAVSDAIRKGAADFVVKPFVPEQLQTALESCVEAGVGA